MRRLTTLFLVIPLLGALVGPAAAQSQGTTEAPTTSVRSDLLPGVELTVEEVEPGVFHVIGDGVRDLDATRGKVVVGHDGSIWLIDEDGVARLGSTESYTFPGGWDTRLVVSPDGTVWVSRTRYDSSEGREVNRIHSLDNGKWTRRLRAPAIGGPHALTVAPDGTLWTTHRARGESSKVVVTHLAGDDWKPLPEPLPDEADVFVTDLGEVWAVRREGQNRLWRYHENEGRWKEFVVDTVVPDPGKARAEVATDGTVWLAGDSSLMRYDEREWQRWGPDDGVPTLKVSELSLDQAPDGGLWMAAPPTRRDAPADAADLRFEGVARFDGSTWLTFLRDHSVSPWYSPSPWGKGWDIAPDGSVWLQMKDPDDFYATQLYVITPEAVAASVEEPEQ
jgi:hypothetical protein